MPELTDREKALVEGFVWIRNIVHQLYHGGGSSENCTNTACQYANKIISRAKETSDDSGS